MNDPGTNAVEQDRDIFKIYGYFAAITLLIGVISPAGYLVDIATSYMLKNRLHASAESVAQFRLLTGIPVFIGFVFGLIRDQWNPFGLRDRGYFLIFGPLTGFAFIWLAIGDIALSSLLIGVIATASFFQLVGAALQGLLTLIGQERLMTGRLSSLYWMVNSVPNVLAAWAGGWVTVNLTATQIFYLLATLSFIFSALGIWKPKAVFQNAYDAPLARTTTFFKDIGRLLRHKPIYPAILINFMFNFAPGGATPLQYFLTDQLHASDAVYGNYTAIFAASFVPTFLLAGYLSKRYSLKTMLIVGTIVTIPQMIPLAFIHTGLQAEILAVPIGLMGGIASVAYVDLAMRSCPAGLQGTLMMLVVGVLALSARGGDLLGTKIYDADKIHGFQNCVIATTIVYALMLPIIWLIPKNIIATRDGEAMPQPA